MTAYEVTSLQPLVARMRSSFPAAETIAIDGIHGTGKTTIAGHLHQLIGGTLVSLDDFIHRSQGSYLPHLKRAELQQAIETANRPMVLEGICMLGALEAIGFEPDLFIYVKRIDSRGDWEDQDIGDPVVSAETIIRKEAARARPFMEALDEPAPADGESGLDTLVEEVIRYHCDFHPASRAQIVYLNQFPG
jgi:hypothetical protein